MRYLSSANVRRELVEARKQGRPPNLSSAIFLGSLAGLDLSGANLSWSALNGVELEGTCLIGANLKGTILDFDMYGVPDLTDEEITNAGLKISEFEGRPIIRGIRTKFSQFVGNHIYTLGEHKAPWFSVCAFTECHPGIYFDSLLRVTESFAPPYVSCYAFRDETVHACTKWRAKRIFVTGELP